MPFGDKTFDFVYCSHVLEVVEEPVKACQEIMRVGARGFIETPTLGKDTLLAWARGLQRWHVVGIGETLCFFEYSERQLDGIKSPAWRDRILSKWYDPLQEIFYENQDVFNVMFKWARQFSVYCFRLDGSVEILNDGISLARGSTPLGNCVKADKRTSVLPRPNLDQGPGYVWRSRSTASYPAS